MPQIPMRSPRVRRGAPVTTDAVASAPTPSRRSRVAPALVVALALLVAVPNVADAGAYLRWPVAGGTISQYFSSRHRAIDIRAPRGTAVYAARSGKVLVGGWKSNGGGYQAWINHGDGRNTTYSHMSVVYVRRGAAVSRGQLIGRVGCTGNCTGPHLHFELWIGAIWNGGYRVNPLKYM